MYCISLLFRGNYAYMYQFKLYGNIDYLTGFTIRVRDGGKICILQTDNFAISTLMLRSEIQ